MNLIGFSPVGALESYINGKLERELMLDVVGNIYSDKLTALWKARKLPIVGKMLGAMAVENLVQVKMSKLFQQGKLRITIPKDLDDPNLESEFETIPKEQ